MALEVPVVDAIRYTIEAIDPGGDAIYVGSAAMALQFEAAGADLGSVKDVDGLWPEAAFDELIDSGRHQTGLKGFELKWPSDEQLLLGAIGVSVHTFPDSAHPNHLKYTAARAMGGPRLIEVAHDTLVTQPDKLVTVSDIRCMRIGEILAWKAILGRSKDIGQVERVLKHANEAGLVEDDERAMIRHELVTSQRLRSRYPKRYFARIPSRDEAHHD